MGVNRRNAVAKFFAAALGGAAWSRSANAAESAGVPKVAYHLADTEKVGFVVGNIANHIKGMGEDRAGGARSGAGVVPDAKNQCRH
jgi:hypothetical protein